MKLFLGMYKETGASVNEDSLPADGQRTGNDPCVWCFPMGAREGVSFPAG